MSQIILGIRLSVNSFERVKLDGVNLDGKIEQLKFEASKAANLPCSQLELVYCGNILEDELTLRANGLKPGCMVHVLRRREKPPPPSVRTIPESEIQDLIQTFKHFNKHGTYRAVVYRVCTSDFIQNIISANPAIKHDPIALAIIKDTDLVCHLENEEIIRKIVETHPALAEAGIQIAATVHELASSVSSHVRPSTSSGFSCALEAFSDDEMDSSQSSDSQPRGSELSRQHSYSAITAAQLAAALASATGSSSSRPSSTSESPGLITSEMFDHAIQQAIATVTSPSMESTNSSEMRPDLQVVANITHQLHQMNELGLTNNSINIQALHATSGDLQAAINLVFSGFLNPDSE